MPRPRAASEKRSDRETTVTVRLPKELHERLKAAGGERGFAADVRERLERSFAPAEGGLSVADPKTAELVDAIVRTADTLQENFGAWHEDRFAYEALRHTVAKLLRFYEPPGEAKATFKSGGWADLIYGAADAVTPEEVANVETAGAIHRIREGRAKP